MNNDMINYFSTTVVFCARNTRCISNNARNSIRAVKGQRRKKCGPRACWWHMVKKHAEDFHMLASSQRKTQEFSA